MQQPPQPTIAPCPQCGGQRIGTGCSTHMQLLKSTSMLAGALSTISALVCLSCGYIMLYADDLPRIQEEVRKHPDNFNY